MVDVRSTAMIQDVLRHLGFTSHVGGDGHLVFRHVPSDTIFLFHQNEPSTLTAMRVESIRRLAVGRGATTEGDFDRALAAAAVGREKRPNGRNRPKPAIVG